jgi:hypothetical protein
VDGILVDALEGSLCMMNSSKLYKASPEAFFEELDKNIAQLGAHLDECISRLDGISNLADRFLTGGLPGTLAIQAPTEWSYFAALPNPYFADVFPPEPTGERTKRWVGRSGRIGARLGLSRALQYDFVIHVIDFVSVEAEASFALTVNGETYPWLSTDNHIFQTMIMENPKETTFDFSVGIDPATVPGGKDVSFSFAMITVARRR